MGRPKLRAVLRCTPTPRRHVGRSLGAEENLLYWYWTFHTRVGGCSLLDVTAPAGHIKINPRDWSRPTHSTIAGDFVSCFSRTRTRLCDWRMVGMDKRLCSPRSRSRRPAHPGVHLALDISSKFAFSCLDIVFASQTARE